VFPPPLIAFVMSLMCCRRSPQRDPEIGPNGKSTALVCSFSLRTWRIFYTRVINELTNAVEVGGMNEEPDDFDDGADKLWSLYEDVAKRHDGVRIQALKTDMDGIPVYVRECFLVTNLLVYIIFILQAGLISAVIAAFVVPKLQDLQVNPIQQSLYYQQQSTDILVQISQQIALIGTQIPLNTTTISSYPTPRPSASDRLVAVLWLISLVSSLSAAVLSAFIQQWVRVYMRVYERSGSPSKRARIRQYLFEGVERLPVVAEAALGLVYLSVVLFFLGLGSSVLKIDRIVGVATVVPMSCCGLAYLYYVIAPIWDPQSPSRNPFSDFILLVIQYLRHGPHCDRSRSRGVWHARMEARQEDLVMEPKRRKDLDVRAVRWLVLNMDKKNEMETFVLAIPGIFDQAWSRKVWAEFSTQGNLPFSPRGTIVDGLCRYVRDVFGIYRNEADPKNKKAQRKRMQGCIETAASLVCCTDVPLGLFGEVGEVLSDLESAAISDPSFTIRWTCLSLVAIRQMVVGGGNRIRERAKSAVEGIAQFQPYYGDPNETAFDGAKGINEHLKTAWQHVEALYRAFELRDQNGIGENWEEIRNILKGCKSRISKLERMENNANDMESVDWWISLLQDEMDRATNKLMQRIPGVSFTKLESSGPIPLTKAFDFPVFRVGSTSTVTPPQFIFLGQQVQALCTLGRGLRDIVENRNPEKHKETVNNLKSIEKIPNSSRRLKDLIIRQLWRLQDLRDGSGLGFTIELFFLAFRQLSSTSSSPELMRVFYTGTFKAITSDWEENTASSGTQRILLNLICDLVIKSRGLFSGFSYPEYIVDLLVELVGEMVNRHGNAHLQIHDAVAELWKVNSRNMNESLRDKALLALGPFPLPMYRTASSSL
jgi:Family of unknown function (DUF6535)